MQKPRRSIAMSIVQHGGQCSGQKPRSVKGVTEGLVLYCEDSEPDGSDGA